MRGRSSVESAEASRTKLELGEALLASEKVRVLRFEAEEEDEGEDEDEAEEDEDEEEEEDEDEDEEDDERARDSTDKLDVRGWTSRSGVIT